MLSQVHMSIIQKIEISIFLAMAILCSFVKVNISQHLETIWQAFAEI